MNALYVFPLAPEGQDVPVVARTVATTNTDGSARSFVDELVWDYHGMLSGGAGTKLELSFEHIDEAIRPCIQKALHAISRGKKIGIGKLEAHRTALKNIAEVLGSTQWNQIDSEHGYTLFKKRLKAKNGTVSFVLPIQTALREMHEVGLVGRYIMPDDNFVTLCATNKIKQQHIAIPEGMSSKMFGAAMEIVERYHPYRHAISIGYDNYHKAMDASEVSTDYFRKYEGQKIPHNVPFDDFFLDGHAQCAQEIQIACWLVLLGFSGVRKKEGLGMNPDSYDDSRRYRGKVVPIIHGVITKNQKAGKPKAESWVTHPIVKQALELAYDMSEFARNRYLAKLEARPSSQKRDKLMEELSSAFLVLRVRSQKESVIMGNMNRRLCKFAEKYDIRATEADVIEFDALNATRKGQMTIGSMLPKLSNHDFRRTYATFLIRNRLGNLMTLRSQTKHDNTLMTAWYQEGASLAAALDLKLDAELISMIETANLEIHENTLFYIFNEAELGGFEGRRIQGEREAYQAKHAGQIYMSREEIRKMLRNNAISVVEHPTGYCFNPTCDRICASDKSTEICKHEVITAEKVREIKLPRHQRWVRKFRALNTGRYYMKSILADIQTEIKAIEKTLSQYGIEFEHFTDPIKALGIEDAK